MRGGKGEIAQRDTDDNAGSTARAMRGFGRGDDEDGARRRRAVCESGHLGRRPPQPSTRSDRPFNSEISRFHPLSRLCSARSWRMSSLSPLAGRYDRLLFSIFPSSATGLELRTYESSTALGRDSWAARLVARRPVGRRRAALSLLDVQRGIPPPREIRLVSRRRHCTPRVGQPGEARHWAACARGGDASSASSFFFLLLAVWATGGDGVRVRGRRRRSISPPAGAGVHQMRPARTGTVSPAGPRWRRGTPLSTAGGGGRLTPAALHDVADAAQAAVVGGRQPRLPTWHRQRAAAAAVAGAARGGVPQTIGEVVVLRAREGGGRVQ